VTVFRCTHAVSEAATNPLDPQEVAEKAFPRSPEFVVADAHYVTFRDAQVVQHRA